jgi:hypothetical protein
MLQRVFPSMVVAFFGALTTTGADIARPGEVLASTGCLAITIVGQLYVAVLIALILGRFHRRAGFCASASISTDRPGVPLPLGSTPSPVAWRRRRRDGPCRRRRCGSGSLGEHRGSACPVASTGRGASVATSSLREGCTETAALCTRAPGAGRTAVGGPFLATGTLGWRCDVGVHEAWLGGSHLSPLRPPIPLSRNNLPRQNSWFDLGASSYDWRLGSTS